jgi:hypothetical protein
MELSAFGRVAAFIAVVLVLAGLAAFLFLPQPSVARNPGRPSRSPSVSPAATRPKAAAPGTADIYQWLPFTQAGLASAAAVTTAFARDYGTFSYTESTAAYIAPMQRLASGQLASVIGRAFASAGVAAQRVSGKQVSKAAAAIISLRAFGSTSITFLVQVTQQISGSSGHSSRSTEYAVTVTGSGTSWRVSDIELAAAGNQ